MRRAMMRSPWPWLVGLLIDCGRAKAAIECEDVADGYKPNAAGTQAAGIPSSFGTGALTTPVNGNCWPNPTSETSPPSGTPVANDGNSVEWDYRLNVGGGAYQGIWVRHIDNSGGGSEYRFTLKLPCVQGDSISLSAQVKLISGAAACGLRIEYFNAAGASLGGNISTTTSGSWTGLSTDYNAGLIPAPAGTMYVLASLTVGAGSVAEFDVLNLYKIPKQWNMNPVTLSTVLLAIAVDASVGNVFYLTFSATPFVWTVGAPSNPSLGQQITFKMKNTSGGVVTINWNAIFKMATWTNPAGGGAGNSRSITFQYDGTNWVQIGTESPDIPN